MSTPKTGKRPKINKIFENSTSFTHSPPLSQQNIISISKCVVELLKPTIEQLIRSIINEIKTTPTNTKTEQTPWGSHPFSNNNQNSPPIQHLIDISNFNASNSDIVIAKSKTAVVEKFPESDGDVAALKEIVKECGLEKDLDEKGIHRHGTNKNNFKPQIFKIHFISTKSRDKFIKSYRKIVKSNPNKYPQQSFSRRDLSPPELKLLYSLRKQAFNANLNCKLYKYIVVDLTIIELSDPKPLHNRQP
ncbi:unnamed protein product [Meloidogyne enterolobii]|uniref:Uncharacterized protein n=1 Tax=Meloidogyne enterolobii TaxID=390850 RepID=A0ACB1ADR4_MELEN